MAILPGRSPRRIYVSGHYDSVNIGGQNLSNSAAPGATPAAIARRAPISIPTSRPTAPTMTAAAPC